MMAYHRAYIDHVADLAKCLTDSTSVKYSKTLIWSEACEHAFFTLKAKLCNVVALSLPRVSGLFILRTDNNAISGCLYQKVDDDIDKVDSSGTGERPIQSSSQKLTVTQSHWSVIEKEAYAVIRSLQKFEHILFCSQIVVFSDHNTLSFLVDCVTQSSKLARWS
jgi:RNase H-like domain found in reverse transcriptase